MTTIEKKLYSFLELSSEAQDRIINEKAEDADLEFSYPEMTASLEAVCESLNLRLVDYAYGPNSRNYKATVRGNCEDLTGPLALAYVLRAFMAKGYARPATFAGMTFPGICGFTGVCYDEMIVETLWKSLLDGNSISEAFDHVAGNLCRFCESELEYLQSRECVLEYLDQSAEIYTENGEEF